MFVLTETLLRKCFTGLESSDKWIEWIMQCISTGIFNIMSIVSITNYFILGELLDNEIPSHPLFLLSLSNTLVFISTLLLFSRGLTIGLG